jgi:S1-C subfamily serine protease
MASGIVIHVSAGDERRTEFFTSEQVKLGTDSDCDLQVEPPADHALNDEHGVWLELHRENGFYRVADFKESLNFKLNDQPLTNRVKLRDGDSIVIAGAELSLSFFNVNNQSALTSNRRTSRSIRFIEEAALESAASPKRDDAKVFLREFVRELVQEVSWTTKLVMLLIALAALSGVFYLGYASYVNNRELAETRAVTRQQGDLITQLRDELARSSGELSKINDSQQRLMEINGLGPKVRNEYGSGVCLLVGTYDLIDKTSTKQLRYPDPAAIGTPDAIEPAPSLPQVSENGFAPTGQIENRQSPLTTEGFGTPVEFDFVGTGFHVGNGYIITNRHVVQPWMEDERVKVMTQMSNGRARLRRLVVYFPGFTQPFTLKVRELSIGEDLAVASLDPDSVFPSIPVLPLDNNSGGVTIGTPVVTLGYPSGPDRILAMVDDAEARIIQSRYTNLQTLVNYLAQKNKINPLLTQGAITDLDFKRIVHDAKTGEGGSGAPLFGASGKVIGVNFGVFTENAAANMAVPIRYALPLLQRAGWQAPDAPLSAQDAEKSRSDNTNSNVNNVNSRNR